MGPRWAVLLTAVLAATAVFAIAVGVGMESVDHAPAPCPATTPTSINETGYLSCSTSAVFGSAWSNVTKIPRTNVTFEGVSFVLFGYNTMECPVLSVSGHEANGTSFGFLIYGGVGGNCLARNPTVLTPDHDAGASWSVAVQYVTLLVRAT